MLHELKEYKVLNINVFSYIMCYLIYNIMDIYLGIYIIEGIEYKWIVNSGVQGNQIYIDFHIDLIGL